MEKKWKNCELHSTEDAKAIKGIRKYCNTHHIPYETSDAGYGYVHFEIYCTTEIALALEAIIKDVADYHY